MNVIFHWRKMAKREKPISWRILQFQIKNWLKKLLWISVCYLCLWNHDSQNLGIYKALSLRLIFLFTCGIRAILLRFSWFSIIIYFLESIIWGRFHYDLFARINFFCLSCVLACDYQLMVNELYIFGHWFSFVYYKFCGQHFLL